jgi:hypothetical protein
MPNTLAYFLSTRQLEQLEQRVASDISTILTILTENRQPTPSNVAQMTPTPTQTSMTTATNPRQRHGLSTTDRTSPPSMSLSMQTNVADVAQHHLSHRSASQPTDISQVTADFRRCGVPPVRETSSDSIRKGKRNAKFGH